MKHEMMDRESVVIMLYLNSWLRPGEDLMDLSDDELKSLLQKWKNEWLPSQFFKHSGDCTKMPWSCIRCNIDDIFKFANKIISLYAEKGENQ